MAIHIYKNKDTIFLSHTGKYINHGINIPLSDLRIFDIVKLMYYKIMDIIENINK